jgi:hypothetical protein
MEFNAIVTGDREVGARFEKWPKEIHDALYQRIVRLTKDLYERVLSLVPERTGELRSEIISKVYNDPESIKGVVTLGGKLTKNEAIKAAALEYGAHGRAKVKNYKRTITEAFGRSISPMSIQVQPYVRQVHIEERSFMRGGLAGIREEATRELTEALNEAFKD